MTKTRTFQAEVDENIRKKSGPRKKSGSKAPNITDGTVHYHRKLQRQAIWDRPVRIIDDLRGERKV